MACRQKSKPENQYVPLFSQVLAVIRELGAARKNAMSPVWKDSIKNHLLHIFEHAAGDSQKVRREYRIMLEEHIINKHENCTHGKIDEVRILQINQSIKLK